MEMAFTNKRKSSQKEHLSLAIEKIVALMDVSLIKRIDKF